MVQAPEIQKSEKQEYIVRKQKFLTAVFLIMISATTGFFGGWVGSRSDGLNSSANSKPAQQIVSSESQLINSIAKNVGASVVSINVTGTSPGVDFFGFGSQIQQQVAGTGIIISSDGVIITNRHVVPKGSTAVSITLSDGTTLDKVSVIGRTNEADPLDIAFLKINDKKGKTLKPASIGDSSKVQVGDRVVAIGNALGQFQNTVTDGIISGYGRSVEASQQGTGLNSESLQNLFQTDAAINEGNSGGPLVSVNSEVIGVNTAVAGNAQNIGFAIPVNDLKGLIKSVLEQGKLIRPYLGVRYVSLTDDIASQYNLSVKRGAYIASGGSQASIIADSPAEKAGLKGGDIIIKVNDAQIDENNSLTAVLGRYSVGDTVTLSVIREGKTQNIKATLAAAPQE